jgi:hypothetical protein
MKPKGCKPSRVSIGKWMWYCPYENCDSKALQLQGFGRAGRHGRMHLKRKHNDNFSKPILEKIKEEK